MLSNQSNGFKSAVLEFKRKIVQYYFLEFSLICIFIFFVFSNMLIWFVIFPTSYELPPPLYHHSHRPLEKNALKLGKTIQDRFQYSKKDLEKQLEPELISSIRSNWLHPPPNVPLNYNALLAENDKHNKLQAIDIFQLGNLKMRLKNLPTNREKGFYIEYGGSDGTVGSPTLIFEFFYNWTGILIEPDPKIFESISEIRRRAWMMNACVSIHPKRTRIKMIRLEGRSIMEEFLNPAKVEAEESGVIYEAECFPLTSIIHAVNTTTVDHLHLRATGAALNILKTVIWDIIDIKIITIIEDNSNQAKMDSLQMFLAKRGYIHNGFLPLVSTTAYIYVHETLMANSTEEIDPYSES